MAFFKHTTPVDEKTEETVEKKLPMEAPAATNGVRDFWQHWDYLLSMVGELAEFGVPVLDAVGLTMNESIQAESDTGQIRAGETLIEKGTKVVPRMLPLLAKMGIVKVMARPSPRVLVMALTQKAVPASYLVAAQAQESGAAAHRLEYIFENGPELVKAITEQLVRADLVVTVGGLGETGIDLREVADQIGPNDFTPVAITPGRDHGFLLAEDRIPVLALPADVPSSFVLTKLLLEPMIAKLMGASTDPTLFSAYLAQPLRVQPRILTCVPATVKDARMTITGRPVGLDGMYTIYKANALAILASDDSVIGTDAETFYLPLS